MKGVIGAVAAIGCLITEIKAQASQRISSDSMTVPTIITKTVFTIREQLLKEVKEVVRYQASLAIIMDGNQDMRRRYSRTRST